MDETAATIAVPSVQSSGTPGPTSISGSTAVLAPLVETMPRATEAEVPPIGRYSVPATVSKNFSPISTEELADSSLEDSKAAQPCWIEVGCGVAAIISWLVFFGGGVLISTQSAHDELISPTKIPFLEECKAVIVAFGFYTITNLIFLAIASAYTGCMAARWQVTQPLDPAAEFYRRFQPMRMYLAAILRGFLLYLFLISGLLVTASESSILNTTPTQYIRLAGLISALGFIVGYDPLIVYRFMSKLSDLGNLPLSGGQKKSS